MIILGLTGSIAMGKSETAKMFAAAGIPVFDSDAAVHRLYSKGGAAVNAVAELVPAAVSDGAVDRSILSQAVKADQKILERLEQAVHPLVRSMQDAFVAQARKSGAELVVLDIPLLFESGRERDVDKIVVVSAPLEIQRDRALKRPGMTQEKLDFILSRQLPDAEKRARADFVVDTSKGLEHAKAQVDHIVLQLRKYEQHIS